MTRREAERLNWQENALLDLGFTTAEAESLRRISMTLRRWYERECGNSNEYGSWAIERDEETGIPYEVRHVYGHGAVNDRVIRTRIPDRERGAERRLKAIIGQRNGRPCLSTGTVRPSDPNGKVTYYLQTDPRGAALYILRPGDVPVGEDPSCYYTRGLCVY